MKPRFMNWMKCLGNVLTRSTVLTVVITMVLLARVADANACTNPVGVAGDMTYNDSEHVMQWCDGTNWYGLARSPYIPNAVRFNTAEVDYLENSSGFSVPSTQRFTVSLWFNRDTITANDPIIEAHDGTGEKFFIYGSNTGGLFWLRASNTAGTIVVSKNFGAIPSGWNHALLSVDLAAGVGHAYFNGADAGAFSTLTMGETPATTFTDVTIGSNITRNIRWDGDMAELWIDFGTYFDLSDPNIRRMFIDASGFPVNLGADGSRPTGSPPDIFLSGDTATWHTNNGTVSGFTENGALADALTDPGENLGPTSGLVGWWKMDETSGTAVTDSSGNGNDGFVRSGLNISTDNTSGIIYSAFDLDLSNGSIEIPYDASMDIPGDFTVSIWTKPSETSTTNNTYGRTIFDLKTVYLAWKWDDTLNQGCFFTIVVGPGGWPGDQSNQCGPYIFDNGSWYHIAFVNNANTFNIYVNNVLYDTFNLATYNGVSGNPFRVGTWQLASNREYDGIIDDMRLYNRALSLAEIQSLYDTGFPCKNPLGQRDGDTMYNLTHHVPQFCNLREWKAMVSAPGDGGAGCLNPVAVVGDMMYNSTSSVMQYCEGDAWKAMGKFGP